MPTIKKQATQLDRALPKQPAKSWPNIALAHPVCDGPLTLFSRLYCSGDLFVPTADGSNSGSISIKMAYKITSDWSRTRDSLVRKLNILDQLYLEA